MSKTICLDAAHGKHGSNIKRSPDGNEEWLLNASVCDKIERILKLYDVDIVRLDDVTGETDIRISDRIEKAKKSSPIAIISIHHRISGSLWDSGIDDAIKAHLSRNVHSKEQLIAEEILSQYHKYTKYHNGHSHISRMLMCNYADYVDDNCVKIVVEGPDLCNPMTNVFCSSESGKDIYAESVANALIYEFHLSKKNIFTRSGENIMYLVRKSLQSPSSEKFRSPNLDNAIAICDEFSGYSVYDNITGQVLHKSTFGKIPTNAKTPYLLTAKINSSTGLALRKSNDAMSERITVLPFGSKVKILDRGVLNQYWKVEASVEGKTVIGFIRGKYASLI